MDLAWEIGGEAGYGIMSAGHVFARSFSRAGFHVFTDAEYPSLIRGGHNSYQVRISDADAGAVSPKIHLLAALNEETIALHQAELVPAGAVLYEATIAEPKIERKDISTYPVPFQEIARKVGEKIMANSAALGASAAMLDCGMSLLTKSISDEYGNKGKAVEQNLAAAQFGYDYATQNIPADFAFPVHAKKEKPKILLTGNDAICLGALRAGLKFHAQYPMTPVSAILHYLAKKQREYGLVVLQPEDEIAAINAAVGASLAGARSMVATSGGGFCLMVEGLGLSAMTETPVVVVLGQRPGPSTGLPTRTEQGDLRFALHASHGDFPRILVAPGDVEECFYETGRVFNLAQKYQVPGIIMVDKFVCEAYRTVDALHQERVLVEQETLATEEQIKRGYRRFAVTDNGVSPRALPGTPGAIHRNPSDEHDEEGYLSEDENVRNAQQGKRWKKEAFLARELPPPRAYGDTDHPDVTLVGWGSTKGPILEALELLKREKIQTSYLQLLYLSPFPDEAVGRRLKHAGVPIAVENNMTAQLAGLVREKTGHEIRDKALKYSGKQFYAQEIADRVKRIFRGS